MTLKSTLFEDPSGNYIDQTVWSSSSDYLWHDITSYGDSNTAYQGGWVLTYNLGPVLKIDGGTATGSWFLYNGERYWEGTNYYLWYNGSNWIISRAIGGLTAEQWDSVDGEYVGDDWYSGPSGSPEGQYNARGSNNTATSEGSQDGTPKNVTFEVDGYRITDNYSHVAPAGEYEEFTRTASVDSSGNVTESVTTGAGTKEVGVPVFENADGTEYIRSFEKDASGHYTYGVIHYTDTTDYTGWIIGTYGSGTWWEGSKPDLDSSVTFNKYELDSEGNKVKIDSMSVSFKEYRMGGISTFAYYGQLRLWLKG